MVDIVFLLNKYVGYNDILAVYLYNFAFLLLINTYSIKIDKLNY